MTILEIENSDKINGVNYANTQEIQKEITSESWAK
jgi:hypothetical protein